MSDSNTTVTNNIPTITPTTTPNTPPPSTRWVEAGMTTMAKVKLTDVGTRILTEYNNRLATQLQMGGQPQSVIDSITAIVIDTDGYYNAPLGAICHIFGSNMSIVSDSAALFNSDFQLAVVVT